MSTKLRPEEVLVPEDDLILEPAEGPVLPVWVRYGGVAAAAALVLARMGGIVGAR